MANKDQSENEIVETQVVASFSPVRVNVVGPSTIGYVVGLVKAQISLAKDERGGFILTVRDIESDPPTPE